MTAIGTRDRDALVESLCGDLSRVRAPRGTELNARSWATEAPLRMLLNNLDPEVAERPEELVVYGGSGKAARNWECFHAIVATLKRLGNDETLLVQSGKPVKNMTSYMAVITTQKRGQPVEVTVVRKGERLTLTVTPQ